MAAGLIDAGRAGWIALYTRSLSPADAARADEVLAEEAPDLRAEQLARKAAALEMKLNPDAVRARREHAKRDGQRVEARREASGNASPGRAGTGHRGRAGVQGPPGRDRGQAARFRAGRRLPGPAARPGPDRPDPGTRPAGPDQARPRARPARRHRSPAARPAARPDAAPTTTAAPVLPVRASRRPSRPLSTSWSPPGPCSAGPPRPPRPAPGACWTPDETRAAAAAAAAHPRTRWCVTLTGPDGTALAHGCARGPRPRLLDSLLDDLAPQPPPHS